MSRRRTALLAAALAVAAGGTAAAVTGVVDRGPRTEADALFSHPPIAEGMLPNGARWQLLAFRGATGFCFGIATPSGDPRELASGGGGACGDANPGTFTIYAASTSGSRFTAPRPRHSLAFGTAPDAAARVSVSAGDARIAVETLDDPIGLKGRFWVAPIPRRALHGHMRARALDAAGRVVDTAGR